MCLLFTLSKSQQQSGAQAGTKDLSLLHLNTVPVDLLQFDISQY
jgi:hypothetical protein